ARTRASTSAKLLAASASEMWTTCFAIKGIISLLIFFPFHIERSQQFGASLDVAFFRCFFGCRVFGLLLGGMCVRGIDLDPNRAPVLRSEEHTSELQSRGH